MSGDIDIYGVYAPVLLVLMAATLPLSMLVRRILAYAGAYDFIWHRGLFDLALYVVLLLGVFQLSQWWLS